MMPQSPILVAGYALVDLVPHPREADSFFAALGGSPFNTALALGRLGAPTAFAGCISTDIHGERLVAALRAARVDVSHVVRCAAPTPLALVTTGAGAEGPRYSFYLRGTAFEEQTVLPRNWRQDAIHLHVGSTSALAGDSADSMLAALGEAQGVLSTSFDPNIRPALLPPRETVVGRVLACVARASIVKASEEDVAWLYPGRDPVESAAGWACMGPRLVILTRGAAGATAFFCDARIATAALDVDVVDTVGAGDTFMAGLLAALHADGALGRGKLVPTPDKVDRWLAFAAAAAAFCCTRAGADPPTREELERLLSMSRDPHRIARGQADA
jgi:fructokinase